MNIRTMIVNFPKEDKSSVIPRDIPQVPNALVISKMISIAEASGSVMNRIIVETMTMNIARIITAYERNTSINWISLLNICIVFLPRAKLMRKRIAIARVVVRMPPPAELGEAPINMRTLMNTFVASSNWVISNVTSPPDLEDTEWKLSLIHI